MFDVFKTIQGVRYPKTDEEYAGDKGDKSHATTRNLGMKEFDRILAGSGRLLTDWYLHFITS